MSTIIAQGMLTRGCVMIALKMFDKLTKENIEMRRKILSILDRGSIYDLRDIFAALVEMGFKEA